MRIWICIVCGSLCKKRPRRGKVERIHLAGSNGGLSAATGCKPLGERSTVHCDLPVLNVKFNPLPLTREGGESGGIWIESRIVMDCDPFAVLTKLYPKLCPTKNCEWLLVEPRTVASQCGLARVGCVVRFGRHGGLGSCGGRF